MPNQEQSRDGIPRKDDDRPSPDTATGTESPRGQDYRGDGPAKVGVTSDRDKNLVAPSGVNERDHGAADDKPMGGGALNFDDDDQDRPRGNTTRTGGTWQAQGGDSGELGRSPGPGLSDRNGPREHHGGGGRPGS